MAHEVKQARALVDAVALGVKAAAHRHGVAQKTIGAWRKKLEKSETLQAHYRRLLDAQDREWLDSTKSLVALCAKTLRAKVEAGELDPFVLFEILKEGSALLVTASALGNEATSDHTGGGPSAYSAAGGKSPPEFH